MDPGKSRIKFDPWVALQRRTYGQAVWFNHESPHGRDGERDAHVLTPETSYSRTCCKSSCDLGENRPAAGVHKKAEIRDS